MTWPIFEKFLPLLFSETGHCVLLQVLKDFFSSLIMAPFFSHPLSVAAKEPCPYPIKCHHTRRTRARGSGYIRLPIKHSVLNRSTKNLFSTYSLLCSVSRFVCSYQLFLFLKNAINIYVIRQLLKLIWFSAAGVESILKRL